MGSLVQHRRKLVGIAKTWAEKNMPTWNDDCHRDLLMRHGASRVAGRYSATTLSATQLENVLRDYETRGWPFVRGYSIGDTTRAVPPAIAHIVRLWGRLYTAGKVRCGTRFALITFCERQVKHDVLDLDSLTAPEQRQVTEALKSWLTREPIYQRPA